jgi:hypothetical protein
MTTPSDGKHQRASNVTESPSFSSLLNQEVNRSATIARAHIDNVLRSSEAPDISSAPIGSNVQVNVEYPQKPVKSFTSHESSFARYRAVNSNMWTLSFIDVELEDGFKKFQANCSLRTFRMTLTIAMIILVLFFLIAISSIPSAAAAWEESEKAKTIPWDVMKSNMSAYCPPG